MTTPARGVHHRAPHRRVEHLTPRMHAQLDETDIEAIARRVLELLPNPSRG